MTLVVDLWKSDDEHEWLLALEKYWEFVNPANAARELEQEMEVLNVEEIARLDGQAWFLFLRDKYFKWKYTAPNRYATTARLLKEHVDSEGLDKLLAIRDDIMRISAVGVREGLLTAKRIPGLGVAEASGLLALLFPDRFGTVDQFVVRALRRIASCRSETRSGK